MGNISKLIMLVLFTIAIVNSRLCHAQCDSPVNLTFSPVKSTGKAIIEAKWDVVNNAQHYEVIVSDTEVILQTGSTALINKHYAYNLIPDKKACVHARTICNGNSTSAWSTYCGIIPCSAISSLAINISIGFAVPGTAQIRWQDAGNPSIRYEYMLTTDSIATGAAKTDTIEEMYLSGLVPGTVYCFHLRYHCANSNTYSAWTSTCFMLPAATGIISGHGTLGKVYPNPANGVLNISLPGNNTPHRLTITDITGKMLQNTTAYTEATQLDISGLSAGVYIMHIAGDVYSGIHRFTVR